MRKAIEVIASKPVVLLFQHSAMPGSDVSDIAVVADLIARFKSFDWFSNDLRTTAHYFISELSISLALTSSIAF